MHVNDATAGWGRRGWLACALLLSGCAHVSDQAIVDNCRAGAGLTLAMCECVRTEMRTSMDAYSYDAIVLLANGKNAEAGGRLEGLTERDRLAVAGRMMSAYSLCAGTGSETAR